MYKINCKNKKFMLSKLLTCTELTRSTNESYRLKANSFLNSHKVISSEIFSFWETISKYFGKFSRC